MVRFADRMDLLKGSAIRELLALANKPDIISFAGGMPAPAWRSGARPGPGTRTLSPAATERQETDEQTSTTPA